MPLSLRQGPRACPSGIPGEVRDLPAKGRDGGDPRAFQEARKSRETLPFMNDDTLLEARSFHSRLIDLLRVEFVSLGAFLEALAEFDRRKLFRTLGHADLFGVSPQGAEALPRGGSSPARRRLARPAIPRGAGTDTRRQAVLHHRGGPGLGGDGGEPGRGASPILRPVQAGGAGTGGGVEAPDVGADEDGGDPGGDVSAGGPGRGGEADGSGNSPRRTLGAPDGGGANGWSGRSSSR